MYMDEAMTIQIHVYACSVEKENSPWSVSVYPRVEGLTVEHGLKSNMTRGMMIRL